MSHFKLTLPHTPFFLELSYDLNPPLIFRLDKDRIIGNPLMDELEYYATFSCLIPEKIKKNQAL